MRVRLSPEATENLNEIFSYIARDNPRAAQAVARELRHAIKLLGEFPDMGVARTDEPSVRIKLSRKYPAYRIFYTVEQDEVLILYVHHAAREE